jgi:mannitol/fructose-specific phosphotransferase system IIA component (Ntr-type)
MANQGQVLQKQVTEWLPRPTGKQRQELFRTFAQNSQQKPATQFSEFLSPGNIQFFHGYESKIQIVESLVRSLPGHDQEAALQAIWTRERDGALGISPDIAILRGRLEKVHYIRAALGICPLGAFDPSNPNGMTRLFILFVGPTTQTHLHMGLLVALSSLFHKRRFVEQLLRTESPEQVLQALQRAEGLDSGANPLNCALRRVTDFLSIRYGWDVDDA